MATVSMLKYRVRGVSVVLFVGSSNNTGTSTHEDGRRGPRTEETRKEAHRKYSSLRFRAPYTRCHF